MKKNLSKSIRLTQEVYDYIDQAPGKGFNEKFENIILEAKTGAAERKKTLADLDERIKEEQRYLKNLFERYRHLNEFFSRVMHLMHEVDSLERALDKAMNVEQSDNVEEKEN